MILGGLDLAGLEYLDFLPGIEGREGDEGVPLDLYTMSFIALESLSLIWAIFVADSKRRWRRISSSISF